MSDLFRNSPAPGRSPDTSAAAAEKIHPKLKGLRLEVYNAIVASQGMGLATEQIAQKINRNYRSVQPRTSELKGWGLIKDSGERRKNSYGNHEIVWIAT